MPQYTALAKQLTKSSLIERSQLAGFAKGKQPLSVQGNSQLPTDGLFGFCLGEAECLSNGGGNVEVNAGLFVHHK